MLSESSAPGLIELSNEVTVSVPELVLVVGAVTGEPCAKSLCTAASTARIAADDVVTTPSSRLYESDEVEKFSLPMKTLPVPF